MSNTLLPVEPYELRLILKALHICRKTPECSKGWDDATIKHLMCKSTYYFGLPALEDLEPEIYKECFGEE